METDVNAELVSDNPLPFFVEFDQRTTVPLRFRTNIDEVDLSQGYDIVLDVEEIAIQGVVVTNSAPRRPGPHVHPVRHRGVLVPYQNVDETIA